MMKKKIIGIIGLVALLVIILFAGHAEGSMKTALKMTKAIKHLSSPTNNHFMPWSLRT